MRMKVQLDVVLDVDESILKDNGETMSDGQIAEQIDTVVSEGSFLSCADEAIEVIESKVCYHSRILGNHLVDPVSATHHLGKLEEFATAIRQHVQCPVPEYCQICTALEELEQGEG